MTQILRGKPLQKAIIEMARRKGWRVAHFPPISTTRNGNTFWLTPVAADGKGFLDLLLLRERILIAEVKGDGDRLTPEQEEWRSAWRLAGVIPHVWTPKLWREGEIERELTRRSPGELIAPVEAVEPTLFGR